MGAPKPVYRQEVIDLDAPKRAWQHIAAEMLSNGDIVPDHGQVESTEKVGSVLYAHFVSGKTHAFMRDQAVHAFTRRR